jgi:hypothetical protein
MISPALRICMETARARLALAGRPVRPEPEGREFKGVQFEAQVQMCLGYRASDNDPDKWCGSSNPGVRI